MPRKSYRLFLLHFLFHNVLMQSVVAAVGGFGVGIGIDGSGGGEAAVFGALQAWKASITSDPHGLLRSWVGPNVCSYKGVFCSSTFQDEGGSGGGGPYVVGIDLNRANLEGSLVEDLAALTRLTLIHLNSNRFSGTIPAGFQALVSLQELELSNNRLSSPFPVVILSMPSLVYLDLRFSTQF
ncbi:hypothetical protein SAY86_008181 [Trapa natans]|uniref:Cell wall hydroxyproline-rich glycoprotein n=1 Tax=Trapa natans TaxID=22666 RepID=A0AAN7KDB4_TRANT|nr:hypothetical protein SAY86_008181 [Trapa natans]